MSTERQYNLLRDIFGWIPSTNLTSIASGGNAIQTVLPARAGHRIQVGMLTLLDSVGSGSPVVEILDGATQIWTDPFTPGADYAHSFNPPIAGSENNTVTVKASATSLVGTTKLYCTHQYIPT